MFFYSERGERGENSRIYFASGSKTKRPREKKRSGFQFAALFLGGSPPDSIFFLVFLFFILDLSQAASSIPSCSAACKMNFRTYMYTFFSTFILWGHKSLIKHKRKTQREQEGGGETSAINGRIYKIDRE